MVFNIRGETQTKRGLNVSSEENILDLKVRKCQDVGKKIA
jgi:hypothetical protein